MDTFYETTIRMLNEFHLLLDRYLDEIPELRLLKLMALNMFAVENSQLKGKSVLFLLFLFSEESESEFFKHVSSSLNYIVLKCSHACIPWGHW